MLSEAVVVYNRHFNFATCTYRIDGVSDKTPCDFLLFDSSSSSLLFARCHELDVMGRKQIRLFVISEASFFCKVTNVNVDVAICTTLGGMANPT